MRWVRQETDKGCGPACIAMVCGITFWEALEAIGTRGSTRYSHLRTALRKHGRRWGPVKQLVRGAPIPCLAIVLFRTDGVRIGHWVVHDDGMFLDPVRGPRSRTSYAADTRPVSYMPML